MAKFDMASVRRFVFRVEFPLYLLFAAIGVALVYMVGSVLVAYVRNGGLVPPPTTLVRYECKGPQHSFVLMYLHGVDRVEIKNSSGVLEGSVQQGTFDWKGFADDRAMLGFLPPQSLQVEANGSIALEGAELAGTHCTKAALAANTAS